MRRTRLSLAAGMTALAVNLVGVTTLSAAPATELTTVAKGAVRSAPVTPLVFDGDVRDLPRPAPWRPGDPLPQVPQRFYGTAKKPLSPPRFTTDPLLQRQLDYARSLAATDFTTFTRNFDGIEFTGPTPSDSNGDAGPNHYIQAVNGLVDDDFGARIRIYDKAAPTPNELATFQLASLSAGQCTGTFGDPIVSYDRQADRWLLSEITGDLTFCVYISQGPDPVTGGWYAYVFSGNGLTDYPKYGVWPTDANGGPGSYVVTINESAVDSVPAIYALDRGAMLAGLVATFQRMTLTPLSGFSTQAPIPADPDGALPPPIGTPAVIMRHRDTEVHGGTATGDLLEMWLLDVDWVDPLNTTLTPATIDVADFDSDLCSPTSVSCIAQPENAPPLQPLHEVIMNRLQYMNFGEHESLVGNFTVDANGADRAGIRWFELRRSGAGPFALHQEGTYSIDPDNRWFGTPAMDSKGNIALGFNVSSAETYPGIRYTGRREFDPPGVMTVAETVVAPGVATAPTERYGDYGSMSLDPTDDCTFWFTTQYSVSGHWASRIASFHFYDCVCDSLPDSLALQATAPADNLVVLSWNDAAAAGVVEYHVSRARTAEGPYTLLAVIPDSSPGSGGGPGYGYDDTDVSGGTTYYYVVTAWEDSCPLQSDNEVAVTATGACTLLPVFEGLDSATSGNDTVCRADLAWAPAVTECGGPSLYAIYRSTTSGFTPSPANLLAGGLTGTSATDVSGLSGDDRLYYVVRALDGTTGIGETNLVEREVTIGGPGSGLTVLFEEPFDSLDAWSVLEGPGQHRCGDWALSSSPTERPTGSSGNYALAKSQGCGPNPRTSTRLESDVIPVVDPDIAAVTLSARLNYAYLDGDDATVEVWDGASWQIIWSDPNADFDEQVELDVTAYAAGNPSFQVRFNYQNAADDLWFAVDDVVLTVLIQAPCTTAPAPPPVPDGDGTTTPLRVDRLDTAGTTLELNWDAASCPAPAYNLLWGDLADVAGPALRGAICDVGAGSFQWSGAPAGDLFMLLVGADASSESSWGDGTFGERNGLTASGECGATHKEPSESCP